MPAGRHGPLDTLVATCRAARRVTGAAAVSISVITDDGLEYVAADGAGADQIVGTVLTGGRGLASYVAASGQALAISHPESDPRFARDVAERTGYVPRAMLFVPIPGSDGDPAGVLTVLDREDEASLSADADVLSLVASFAEIAAGPVQMLERDGDEAVDLVDRLVALGPDRQTVVHRTITAMIDAFET